MLKSEKIAQLDVLKQNNLQLAHYEMLIQKKLEIEKFWRCSGKWRTSSTTAAEAISHSNTVCVTPNVVRANVLYLWIFKAHNSILQITYHRTQFSQNRELVRD